MALSLSENFSYQANKKSPSQILTDFFEMERTTETNPSLRRERPNYSVFRLILLPFSTVKSRKGIKSRLKSRLRI
jgi:hypothetical protein